MSAEVRERLIRIRKLLQQRDAEAAARQSTVTLKAEGMPLSKVLAAIQQQTENKVVDSRHEAAGPTADPPLTVPLDKTPFWTALDQVADLAQVSVYPFGQPDAVQLVPRDPQQLPRTGRAALAGPLRVEPTRVIARRDLRSSAPASLVLSMEVAWEPRLHPIGLKQRMAEVKAIDDHGEPIPVDDAKLVNEALPQRGASAVEMEIILAMPSRAAREIATLRGSFDAMVPGKVETFTFADLRHAKKVEQRIAAATVTLDEVRRNGDTWEVYVRMQLDDAGDALESHRNWALANDAYLETPDGKQIPFDSLETTQRTSNQLGVGYVFALDQPPANLKFVYKTPGTVVTKTLAYEVKGVKLP
jgi:hypothetical protein